MGRREDYFRFLFHGVEETGRLNMPEPSNFLWNYVSWQSDDEQLIDVLRELENRGIVVRELSLRYLDMTAIGLEALAASQAMQSLEHLLLPGAEDLSPLAESKCLRRLKSLALGYVVILSRRAEGPEE